MIAFADPLTEADLSDLVGSPPGNAPATRQARSPFGRRARRRRSRRRALRGRRTSVACRTRQPRTGRPASRDGEAGVSRRGRRRHRSAEPRRPPAQRRVRGRDRGRVASPPERSCDPDGHQGRRGCDRARQRSRCPRSARGASGVASVSGSGRSVSTSGGLSRCSASGLGDRPIALVIGAEGRGLAPLSRQRCDVLARIPLHGSIDSLNVSAAGAVAMFEVARQRCVEAG